MTRAEQNLADKRARGEIAMLLNAASKLNAKTAKLSTETRWYPFVVTAAIFDGALAIARFFSG